MKLKEIKQSIISKNIKNKRNHIKDRSRSSKTSKKEQFMIIGDSFQPYTTVTQSSFLNV